MRTGWMTGLLAATAVLSGSLLSMAQPPPAAALPAPGALEPFTVGDADRVFDSSTARGSYLAVHFLLSTDCPYCTKLVREYVEQGPTLAGVRQVFVKNVPPEEFKQSLRELQESRPAGDPPVPIYRDVDGQLAKRFRVADGYAFHGGVMTYPALVLLDPAGVEVFRHTGKSNSDRVPFATFASKVAELSRNKETANANPTPGAALAGYDPVAYLNEQKAVPGQASLTSNFRGLTYRFANPANRAKFNAEPIKYLPAYGGWCATAMAEGRKVEVDPRNFRVTNGRVLLFYKGLIGNAQTDWNKDEAGLAAKADRHWSTLTADPAGR